MQRQQVSVAFSLGAAVGYSYATLPRDAQGETIEFLVLTRWASLAGIRAFAGEDPGRAVVEPAAVAALGRLRCDGAASRSGAGRVGPTV
jgi:hypothetical protein